MQAAATVAHTGDTDPGDLSEEEAQPNGDARPYPSELEEARQYATPHLLAVAAATIADSSSALLPPPFRLEESPAATAGARPEECDRDAICALRQAAIAKFQARARQPGGLVKSSIAGQSTRTEALLLPTPHPSLSAHQLLPLSPVQSGPPQAPAAAPNGTHVPEAAQKAMAITATGVLPETLSEPAVERQVQQRQPLQPIRDSAPDAADAAASDDELKSRRRPSWSEMLLARVAKRDDVAPPLQAADALATVDAPPPSQAATVAAAVPDAALDMPTAKGVDIHSETPWNALLRRFSTGAHPAPLVSNTAPQPLRHQSPWWPLHCQLRFTHCNFQPSPSPMSSVQQPPKLSTLTASSSARHHDRTIAHLHLSPGIAVGANRRVGAPSRPSELVDTDVGLAVAVTPCLAPAHQVADRNSCGGMLLHPFLLVLKFLACRLGGLFPQVLASSWLLQRSESSAVHGVHASASSQGVDAFGYLHHRTMQRYKKLGRRLWGKTRRCS